MFLPQDYGGYLALMMLKSTEKLIRCAALQAPVIDWSMYGEQSLHMSPVLSHSPQGMEIFITSATVSQTLIISPAATFSPDIGYCVRNVTLIILMFCFRELGCYWISE